MILSRKEARAPIDVRGLRASLGLTQNEFSERFGISVHTLRDWERGRYEPTGIALTLLLMIKHDPAAVSQMVEARTTTAAA